MSRAAALALAFGLAAPIAASPTAWREYDAKLARACPSHHVGWICDGCYGDLIAAFNRSLPAAARGRVDGVARPAVARLCAQDGIGLSCEMAAYLDAYRRARVLDRFVAFGCHTVKCEEAALCSRFPGQRG